mgnify:FL=1
MQSDDKKGVSPEEKEVKLRWAPILLVGFLSLFCMLAFYVIGLKTVGHETYTGAIEWFEQKFGLSGAIFLYTYVVDTLILPLSPDLVWMVAAGMDALETIFLVGSASFLGGVTSYCIGLLIDKIAFVRKLTQKANDKWGAYIKVYGTPFLIISAVLPLPFSTICTVAGAVHLPSKKVIPVCLLRIVHAAIYYWLFRAGLLLI